MHVVDLAAAGARGPLHTPEGQVADQLTLEPRLNGQTDSQSKAVRIGGARWRRLARAPEGTRGRTARRAPRQMGTAKAHYHHAAAPHPLARRRRCRPTGRADRVRHGRQPAPALAPAPAQARERSRRWATRGSDASGSEAADRQARRPRGRSPELASSCTRAARVEVGHRSSLGG